MSFENTSADPMSVIPPTSAVHLPYAIHHSDSPSTILVTPLLTGDNYGSWNRAITMALRAKNKLGFVNGSLPKPELESEIQSWERCNDLVSSWILNSVSPEIRPSILYAESAAQIWSDLYDPFSQSNAPKIYQLKQAISTLKQAGLSVSLYFTQLKSLWDELTSITPFPPCICGNAKLIADQQNQDRAMEFLQGLHDSFSAIRSQVLLMEPFPSVQRIYNLIRQEEMQQELNLKSVPTADSAAFHTSKQQWSSPSTRFTGKRPRPYCDHCNKHGHTRAKCYQIHGFPDKQVTKSESSPALAASSLTSEHYSKLLALLSKEDSDMPSANLAGTAFTCISSSWIIDSGASNHICSSLSFFNHYSSVDKNLFVQLPDGTKALVTHIGTVHCSKSLILTNVFLYPIL